MLEVPTKFTLMSLRDLNDRERRILEAVIQSYVETAEPAGSRTLARRFGLGVSPATIRNTLSDLEAKGYLYHPHTSAGRVPTDRAYRMYVDSLDQLAPLVAQERDQLVERILAGGSAIETVLRCAAQSLSVLTQELGVALGPSLEETVLLRIELVQLSSERLLIVMTLEGAAMRTIFVEAPGSLAEETVAAVTAGAERTPLRADAARDSGVAGRPAPRWRGRRGPLRASCSTFSCKRATPSSTCRSPVRPAWCWASVGSGRAAGVRLRREAPQAHRA